MFRVITILLFSIAIISAQVEVSPTPTQWLGTPGQEIGTITLTNNTSTQRQVDGVRATFDGAEITLSSPSSGVKSITAVTDGNGPNRFDVQVLPTIIGITPKNFLHSGTGYDLPITTSSVADSVDWTPRHPQILVLGGKSLAEEKPNKDIEGITLEELDSIINDPATRFHDSTLFVRDTLGIRGSEWGCGFIDTWVDQETGIPIWQIQVNEIPFVDSTVSPPDTFRFWNENKAFLPDSLDVDDINYGATKRPFYLMGLAMTQEYMNIDMQSLMGKGFQESNAGLSMGYSKETPGYSDTIYDTVQVTAGLPPEWSWGVDPSVGAGDTVSYSGKYYRAKTGSPHPNLADPATWGWTDAWEEISYSPSGTMTDSIFVDTVIWQPSTFEIAYQNVKYTNRAVNGATSMGPMHYEEATFGDQIYDAYPKYFPYDATKPNSGKYINASTGGSPLNHPSIVNAYLISSLNMWYAWQLIVAALGEDALDQMKNATDRRLMGDVVNYAWNQGVYGNYKAAFEAGGIDFIYIDQINSGINQLEKANQNSVLNGGDRKVYDSPIDNATFEEFFFGVGGSGSSGTLGTNGLLHHFDLDVAKRQELWSEVDSAFNMLKGKAPSTTGSQNVSYRYDYLAILRIAKKFLDLSLPIPKTDKFDNWTTDPVAEAIDNIAPYLAQNDKGPGNVVSATFHKEFQVYDIADMPDSAGISGVSWTMDSNWTGWMNASDLGGGLFDIAADKYYINSTLPVGVDTAVAYVRVSDVNGNELIDTFRVWRNLDSVTTIPPLLDSTGAYDSDGDGQADNIQLFLTFPSASDPIESISAIQYSWPTLVSLQTPAHTTSGTIVTLTDIGTMTGGAGTGEVRFGYPSQLSYTGTVLDRVGPALTGSATLSIADASRAQDTLALTISEQLSSSLTGTAYLVFAVDTTGATVTETNVSFSQNSATFTKDQIGLSGYKWVKLASSNGVTDLAGNTPATNSRWVPLQISGGKEPLFDGAQVYDRDGDGIADSLFMSLTLGTVAGHYTIDSLLATSTFNWDGAGDVTFGTGLSVTKTESTLSLINDSLSVAQQLSTGKGSGTLSLNFPDSYTLPGSIVDKVGPAAKGSATVNAEDESRTNDTLYLKVTEALQNSFTDNFGYVEFSTDSGLTSSDVVHAANVSYISEDSVVIAMPKDFTTSTNYVWVRLVSSNGFQDIAGNYASTNSQWIPLVVRGGRTPTVTAAALFDNSLPRDGSGNVVEVALSLSSMPDFFTADSILSSSVTWNSITETGTVTILDDSTVTITVADGKLGGTSGSGVVTLNFPDNKSITGVLQDSLAPVIVKAVYSPGEVDGEGNLIDTLTITFSEPLTSYPGVPANLEFNNEYSGLYSLPIDSLRVTSPTTIQFFTTITETSVSPANGDSIHLVSGVLGISDGRNEQTETTVWTPLSVNPYTYNFSVSIHPNLFNLKDPEDNSALYAKIGYSPKNSHTMAIIVQAIGNRQLQGDLVGTLAIFDPVGNLVYKDKQMAFIPSSSKLVSEFNGYNQRGRTLQAGFYHAIIQLEGNSTPLRTNIGISHGYTY